MRVLVCLEDSAHPTVRRMRRVRCPDMVDYRRYHVSGGTYFFTLVTHLRRRILTSELGRCSLHAAIAEQQAKRPFELVAIVLLPDHLHAVWTLPRGDDKYSLRWSQIKEEFTRRFLAGGGCEAPQSRSRDPLIELVVLGEARFNIVDDWIAEQAEFGDIVVTADIPLASRCLSKQARVLGPRGVPFTEQDIGASLAMRNLMDVLRQSGTVTGGPPPMTPKDRSRFLCRLDEIIHAVRRAHNPKC